MHKKYFHQLVYTQSCDRAYISSDLFHAQWSQTTTEGMLTHSLRLIQMSGKRRAGRTLKAARAQKKRISGFRSKKSTRISELCQKNSKIHIDEEQYICLIRICGNLMPESVRFEGGWWWQWVQSALANAERWIQTVNTNVNTNGECKRHVERVNANGKLQRRVDRANAKVECERRMKRENSKCEKWRDGDVNANG